MRTVAAMEILGSSLFFISGLRFLPIAEASATGFVAPLLVTALSIMFLGEKVGLRRWIATGVGLIGVLIILRPGTGAFEKIAGSLCFPNGTSTYSTGSLRNSRPRR